jgi:TPR repeat protein
MKKILLIFAATILLSNISNASSHSESLKQGIKEHAAFNFIEAFEILSPLAANGDDEAQLYLGLMFRNGEGVEIDNFKAFKFFKQSAEQGNAWSQKHLAWMYIDGKGILKDYKQAKYWFQMAYTNDDAWIRQDAKDAWDELELWKY